MPEPGSPAEPARPGSAARPASAARPGRAVRPVLTGPRVSLRPGGAGDVAALRAILAEPSVARWWGEPDPAEVITAHLTGSEGDQLLVIEAGGQIAGGIQYHEENEPRYRHAGIDIYLSGRCQNQGLGAEAVALLASFLLTDRGHHRLTIDPAAGNARAIACYRKAGFLPVGIMRQYEGSPDGSFHDGLLMDLLRGELIMPGPAQAPA
ncbi:MAG: GNAT family N-acetyltransferase [Actinobacteria bacterium]|nr:GNAT family N-acetyltransferase [Actinomycetota bacterium]